MKNVAVLSVLVIVCFCGLSYGKDKYTTKYDNVDLDAIIANDRLLRNYIDCVLGKRGCTKDGEELKKHIEEALQTNCDKCSESQRAGSKKVISHLIKNKRSWWNELEAKFDPQRSYRKKYADELRKSDITV